MTFKIMDCCSIALLSWYRCCLSLPQFFLLVWNIQDGLIGIQQLQQWLLLIYAVNPSARVYIVGTHYDDYANRLSTLKVKETVIRRGVEELRSTLTVFFIDAKV